MCDLDPWDALTFGHLCSNSEVRSWGERKLDVSSGSFVHVAGHDPSFLCGWGGGNSDASVRRWCDRGIDINQTSNAPQATVHESSTDPPNPPHIFDNPRTRHRSHGRTQADRSLYRCKSQSYCR